MTILTWTDISPEVLKLYETAPNDAFPYLPPTALEKEKYRDFFERELSPLPHRRCKRIFDIFFGGLFFLLSMPVLVLLYISYKIEGFLIPDHKGPFLYFYYSVSQGQRIKKWKIRQVKWQKSDDNLRSTCDWIAFSAEWDKESLTVMGNVVKKFYLDELPQFWSIIIGDISFVGPRPLSTVHYLMDRDNNNICRTLLPGGLLGMGHLNKGTNEMGKASYEYEYLRYYSEASCFKLIMLDLKIIYKGLVLVLKGGGH